jgi:hypothetical protein
VAAGQQHPGAAGGCRLRTLGPAAAAAAGGSGAAGCQGQCCQRATGLSMPSGGSTAAASSRQGSVLLCHTVLVQQPVMCQSVWAHRAGPGVRAQLRVWRLPCGTLLWACLSAGRLEAAQAGVRSTSSSRSCRRASSRRTTFTSISRCLNLS